MPDGGPRIQASELPAILWGEQLPLYLDKIGQGESFDSLLMRRGRAWESVVADEYAEQTGRPVRDVGAYVIQQHPTIPWLGATLDRVTQILDNSDPAAHDGSPLQIKVAMGRAAEWEHGPPLAVQTQVQAEIACWGSIWGAIAALTNYFAPLQTFDIERDDEFLTLALPHIEEFRDRVRLRIPPEPRSSLALPALKRMYGTPSGETITPGPEATAWVANWERAKTAQAASEEWKLESEAKLRALMAGASWARLDDGSLLMLSRRKDGVTVLKHEHPRRGR